MKHELKIEIPDADLFALIRDKTERPDGLTIEGPICTTLASPNAPSVAPYIIAIISFAGKLVGEAAKDVFKERIKVWLADYLARHKATRAWINGKKTETRADVERIIGQEIDISKHD
jgi:hypothetical protein